LERRVCATVTRPKPRRRGLKPSADLTSIAENRARASLETASAILLELDVDLFREIADPSA
jgi:hypothetical protein